MGAESIYLFFQKLGWSLANVVSFKPFLSSRRYGDSADGNIAPSEKSTAPGPSAIIETSGIGRDGNEADDVAVVEVFEYSADELSGMSDRVSNERYTETANADE